MALFGYSNAAIDVAYNSKLNDGSKHIEVTYHFTREQIEQENVSVRFLPSKENFANICTN